MSAARAARRAGRNLLIALLIGALIIVAIVIAYVAGRNTSTPSAGPTSRPLATTTISAASSGTADAAPTGCLGGAQRDHEMVLAAQRLAPKTTFGAVEVATAYYRWTYRFPVPSSADIESVAPVFVPSDAAASESSLKAGYSQNPNPSTGAVADGKPFYVSTVSGKWIATGATSATGATVGIEAPYVIDGVVSATKTATASFDMRWVDGRWRVAGLAKGDPGKLSAGGTTFTAGC